MIRRPIHILRRVFDILLNRLLLVHRHRQIPIIRRLLRNLRQGNRLLRKKPSRRIRLSRRLDRQSRFLLSQCTLSHRLLEFCVGLPCFRRFRPRQIGGLMPVIPRLILGPNKSIGFFTHRRRLLLHFHQSLRQPHALRRRHNQIRQRNRQGRSLRRQLRALFHRDNRQLIRHRFRLLRRDLRLPGHRRRQPSRLQRTQLRPRIFLLIRHIGHFIQNIRLLHLRSVQHILRRIQSVIRNILQLVPHLVVLRLRQLLLQIFQLLFRRLLRHRRQIRRLGLPIFQSIFNP